MINNKCMLNTIDFDDDNVPKKNDDIFQQYFDLSKDLYQQLSSKIKIMFKSIKNCSDKNESLFNKINLFKQVSLIDSFKI